jgi:hypothetical protein
LSIPQQQLASIRTTEEGNCPPIVNVFIILKYTHIFIHQVGDRMMEAASTSEILVKFYQTTWHNNPENSHLHTHHHKNLKSHQVFSDIKVQ